MDVLVLTSAQEVRKNRQHSMTLGNGFPGGRSARSTAILNRISDSIRHPFRRRQFNDWRRDPRYRVELEGELDGAPCNLEDISIGGARVVLRQGSAPKIGDPVRLVFTLGSCGHSIGGVVLRANHNGLSSQLGIAFAGDQQDAIDLLASSLTDLDAAQAS